MPCTYRINISYKACSRSIDRPKDDILLAQKALASDAWAPIPEKSGAPAEAPPSALLRHTARWVSGGSVPSTGERPLSSACVQNQNPSHTAGRSRWALNCEGRALGTLTLAAPLLSQLRACHLPRIHKNCSVDFLTCSDMAVVVQSLSDVQFLRPHGL